MEWMDEKEVQQTSLVGIKERFCSLKENSAYLEAAKNGAMLCIKNGVMKWMSLKEGSLRIFRQGGIKLVTSVKVALFGLRNLKMNSKGSRKS